MAAIACKPPYFSMDKLQWPCYSLVSFSVFVPLTAEAMDEDDLGSIEVVDVGRYN